MSEASGRDVVMSNIDDYAKGRVYEHGPGLAWVSDFEAPISMDGTLLLEKHGWYIGAVYPNWEAHELCFFAFPLPEWSE